MAVFSPADAAMPAKTYLTREEAATLSSNVFLLNPANQHQLRGENKGLSRIIAVLVLLVLGITGLTCVGSLLFAIMTVRSADRSMMLLITVVVAVLFVGSIALIYNANRHSIRNPTDSTYLEGTIVSVAIRERSTGMTVFLTILAVGMAIIDILAAFSGSSSGGGDISDFYEVTVTYTAVTQSGTTINGMGKHNRPDLRKTGLPAAGTPVLVSYQDDAHFEML
ncbi:MAG: hypothetical protein IT324_33615 [Anaerolineae bacterium]|nr:hypothetical protein [Anaerolineae bacterium]